jgi:hypothetical protein
MSYRNHNHPPQTLTYEFCVGIEQEIMPNHFAEFLYRGEIELVWEDAVQCESTLRWYPGGYQAAQCLDKLQYAFKPGADENNLIWYSIPELDCKKKIKVAGGDITSLLQVVHQAVDNWLDTKEYETELQES